MSILQWFKGLFAPKASQAIQVVAEPMPDKTYEIVENGKAIKCLRCGKTSWHFEDVRHLYCGMCHQFHERVKWN